MAITVNSQNSNKNISGLTTGNEHIWEIGTGSVATITCTNTAAGTATIKYSSQGTTPTDFTNFVTSEIGSHSSTFGESASIGIKWIGVDIDSGTWDIDISQTKV